MRVVAKLNQSRRHQDTTKIKMNFPDDEGIEGAIEANSQQEAVDQPSDNEETGTPKKMMTVCLGPLS
jgi:hypothetical protein